MKKTSIPAWGAVKPLVEKKNSTHPLVVMLVVPKHSFLRMTLFYRKSSGIPIIALSFSETENMQQDFFTVDI